MRLCPKSDFPAQAPCATDVWISIQILAAFHSFIHYIMRFFHCILLISAWPCALSTDSESLMQVDVKTHDEKNIVATGVFNTLRNKLDEAALGSGNHLAVSAMLTLAEQAAPSIPTAADSSDMDTILSAVQALLHEILWDDLITVKNAEYTEMIGYSASSMVSCTDPATYAGAQALLATAVTFRTTHNDCRAEENNKYDYYLGAGTEGNCTIAIARATTIMGSVTDRTGTHSLCTVPNPCGSGDGNPCEHEPEAGEAALPGTIGEWQVWFQTGKDTFGNSAADSYQHPTTGLPESVQQACVNSKIAYTLQREQCETDQTAFEQKWCEFRAGLITMCQTRASCSSGVSSSYSALEPSWIAASALRAKQACIL